MRFSSARQVPVLAAAAALTWALPARAEIAGSLSAAPPSDASTPLPLVGVMLDAGLPDGANASLVLRPVSWLRAHAGGGTNAISPGVRVGATLLPFGSGPSATIEGGHYFEGNANGLAQRF